MEHAPDVQDPGEETVPGGGEGDLGVGPVEPRQDIPGRHPAGHVRRYLDDGAGHPGETRTMLPAV
jgi:hypothetical protein